MTPPDLHSQLIDLSAKWLAVKHAVVITDMSHGLGETADAIGWTSGFSTLVECKASRADFLNDRHKPWRRDPSHGMGTYRYYATPAGLLDPAELPENWGLLELKRGRLKVIVKAKHLKRWAHAETSLLVSALRRVAHTCPAGVAVKCYTIQSDKARATLGVVPDVAAVAREVTELVDRVACQYPCLTAAPSHPLRDPLLNAVKLLQTLVPNHP